MDMLKSERANITKLKNFQLKNNQLLKMNEAII
jgi:hypothetical protein